MRDTVRDCALGASLTQANGASASERSAAVTASSGLLILIASVGRSGRMIRTTVRAPRHSGSPQSCSLTLTTASSPTLRMPRARIIRSSAASFRTCDAIRLRKKGAIRSSNCFAGLGPAACVRRRRASPHRLNVRRPWNDAKDGLCLCAIAAVRRQAGVTAVRARNRIVEFLHAGPR
jgi:hypothetical protein